jgi:hypothetical protein
MKPEWSREPTSHEVRVARLVLAWVDSRGSRSPLASSTFVSVVAVLSLVLGFSLFAAAVSLGYLAWSLFVAAFRFSMLRDLLPMLAPALEAHPEGLEDSSTAMAVLDASRVYDVPRKRRQATLRAFVKGLLGDEASEAVSDCSAGHTPLCSHRMSGGSRQFWITVASR